MRRKRFTGSECSNAFGPPDKSNRLRFVCSFTLQDNPQFLNRFSKDEKAQLLAASSILHNHVLSNAIMYTTKDRSPPSATDCYILAFGQIRPAIVVTDDLGMHKLAGEFEIDIWHGHELLKKMLSAKRISNDHVREIYEALEINNDLPQTWRAIKHVAFKKIFGQPR